MLKRAESVKVLGTAIGTEEKDDKKQATYGMGYSNILTSTTTSALTEDFGKA